MTVSILIINLHQYSDVHLIVIDLELCQPSPQPHLINQPIFHLIPEVEEIQHIKVLLLAQLLPALETLVFEVDYFHKEVQ
jgi:hypothetical protein